MASPMKRYEAAMKRTTGQRATAMQRWEAAAEAYDIAVEQVAIWTQRNNESNGDRYIDSRDIWYNRFEDAQAALHRTRAAI